MTTMSMRAWSRSPAAPGSSAGGSWQRLLPGRLARSGAGPALGSRAERRRGRGRTRRAWKIRHGFGPGPLGADAVVHCAGAISARSKSASSGSIGTARAALAAASSPSRTAPAAPDVLAGGASAGVSPYAASKRDGGGGGAPHAGRPGRVLHRAAAGRLRPRRSGDPADLPPDPAASCSCRQSSARFSLLYVEDLAEIVARLLERAAVAIASDRARRRAAAGMAGRTWRASQATQLDRRVRTVPVPRLALWLPAALAQVHGHRSSRRAPMLSRGKLRELYHRTGCARPAPGPLWPAGPPRVDFDNGLAATLAWYRQRGWL